jgi:hypothetical protein
MQIIQLFRRRPPAKAPIGLVGLGTEAQGQRGPRGPRMAKAKRVPLQQPGDDVDEIFAKLAAVPWIQKTPVVF